MFVDIKMIFFKLKMGLNILVGLYIFIPLSFYGQSSISILKNLGSSLDRLKDDAPKTLIYIRTNKGIYETGEDLWFKSYILDDTYLEPTVLYRVMPIDYRKRVLKL
jgi:hypothetical protein